MSFKAKIFTEGQDRNILNASMIYSKFADVNGKPTADAMGQAINIRIESTGNDDFFYHNMFSLISKCKGEIIFYKRDGLSTLFKMEFANAQITGLSEHFNAINNMPLYLNLVISWGIMRMRNIVFEKPWNFNNPFLKGAAPTIINQEDEKELTRYFLTDLQGNEINDYKTGETIILNIATKNRIGDSITVNLNDVEHDFKYKGQLLVNDTLSGIVVGSDLEQLELEVIKQQ